MTTTLYIFRTDTDQPYKVIARAHGETNEECERVATQAGYLGVEDIGATYTLVVTTSAADMQVEDSDDAVDLYDTLSRDA